MKYNANPCDYCDFPQVFVKITNILGIFMMIRTECENRKHTKFLHVCLCTQYLCVIAFFAGFVYLLLDRQQQLQVKMLPNIKLHVHATLCTDGYLAKEAKQHVNICSYHTSIFFC